MELVYVWLEEYKNRLRQNMSKSFSIIKRFDTRSNNDKKFSYCKPR